MYSHDIPNKYITFGPHDLMVWLTVKYYVLCKNVLAVLQFVAYAIKLILLKYF